MKQGHWWKISVKSGPPVGDMQLSQWSSAYDLWSPKTEFLDRGGHFQ